MYNTHKPYHLSLQLCTTSGIRITCKFIRNFTVKILVISIYNFNFVAQGFYGTGKNVLGRRATRKSCMRNNFTL